MISLDVQIFIMLTTLFNIFWAISWKKSDVFNLCVKVIFFMLSGYGLFILMKLGGYIVKV